MFKIKLKGNDKATAFWWDDEEFWRNSFGGKTKCQWAKARRQFREGEQSNLKSIYWFNLALDTHYNLGMNCSHCMLSAQLWLVPGVLCCKVTGYTRWFVWEVCVWYDLPCRSAHCRSPDVDVPLCLWGDSQHHQLTAVGKTPDAFGLALIWGQNCHMERCIQWNGVPAVP